MSFPYKIIVAFSEVPFNLSCLKFCLYVVNVYLLFTDTKSCAHPPIPPATSALTIAAYIVAGKLDYDGNIFILVREFCTWAVSVRNS